MAHRNKQNYSAYSQKRVKTEHQKHGKHRRAQERYSLEESQDRLRDLLGRHGCEWVSSSALKQLALFYRLLVSGQDKQNFTRLLTMKDIAIKHFIDSLLLVSLLREGRGVESPLLDLGTGPGFPGIPIAIAEPDSKIMLAEGVQKRVEFLKIVRDKLELKNVEIFGRNIDETFEYPVSSVVTRAVEEAKNTLSNVSSCLKVGSYVYLMKGPQFKEEIKRFESGPMVNQFQFVKVIEYDIPKTPHKRSLLVFHKFAQNIEAV